MARHAESNHPHRRWHTVESHSVDLGTSVHKEPTKVKLGCRVPVGNRGTCKDRKHGVCGVIVEKAVGRLSAGQALGCKVLRDLCLMFSHPQCHML